MESNYIPIKRTVAKQKPQNATDCDRYMYLSIRVKRDL